MLQMESAIPVADNTGARMAKMIGVLGKKNTRFAYVGDVITAHVRESTPTAAVKKGEVVRAVVVRTAHPIRRADGSILRFDRNPHLRPGRPRASRQELHEDRLPRPRSAVIP